MRWLLNVLKSPAFLISFGVALAAALIILLGVMFDIGWIVRILAIMVVLFVVVTILAIKFSRVNRSADEIEKSIKKQAEQQLLSTRPDKQAEIEELQRQLERSIEQLKESKLGRGKRGRAALYALPWYLFIGPPGAGKTTAITNSGLSFPLGSDRVRGVGGTRNCDWFFSDQAILLDTAGRYMTEQEDTEEWLAFLDTLKQHRSERPINGVIVGIALPDLALATPDEVEEHADNIRRRADELVQRLGVRFPLYLVFTKSDMLQGFTEFFGELSRKDREQIWGCTLDEKQQQESSLRHVFEEEFDRLVHALVNRRTPRLSRPMKREERQKVYAFPLQFATVKDNLAQFVARLFQSNPYQETPVFRGFYFTSGTQEGVPLDRVILAIARQFELPTTGLQQFEGQQETKSYFIKDLFTDVIVPDQLMVRRTSKARRAGGARRVGVAVASIVVGVLFVLGAVFAMMSSRSRLADTRAVVQDVRTVDWQDAQAVNGHLGRVEALRLHNEELDKTVWFGLGLSRNGRVLRHSKILYLNTVRDFVENYLFTNIDRRIRDQNRQPLLDDAARKTLTNNLKAYLLLTDKLAIEFVDQDFLDKEENRGFLAKHLTDEAIGALATGLDPVEQNNLRDRVERQMKTFVEALQRQDSLAFTADHDLIANTRNSIRRPFDYAALYEILLSGGSHLRPIRLADLGSRNVNLLNSTSEVPGLFTEAGMDQYVFKTIDTLSVDPTKESWVMGPEGEDVSEEFGTKDEVFAELTNRYFDDYADAWERFLRSVTVRAFSSPGEAADGLEKLGNRNDSPIGYLLARVAEETRFTPEEDTGQEAGGGGAAGITRLLTSGSAKVRMYAYYLRNSGLSLGNTEKPKTPVDERFAALHRLKPGQLASGGAAADLQDAFDALQALGSTLDGIAGDQKAVYDFAALVLENNGGDLDRTLDAVQGTLSAFPDARENLFETPVSTAWSTVLAATRPYLDKQWEEEVYDAFHDELDLAGRYPFDKSSQRDARPNDVETFFGVGESRMEVFVNDYLEPFIEDRRRIDEPKTWQRRGIRLSSAAVRAIERGRVIGTALFKEDALRFELKPEQPDNPDNADVDEVTIRIHGTTDVFNLGGAFPEAFEWPGRAPDAEVQITMASGGSHEIAVEGPWALFRLLQAGNVQRVRTDVYALRWLFETPRYRITAKYEMTIGNDTPPGPFDNPNSFFDFQLPRSLF